jgi:hypothetical protein
VRSIGGRGVTIVTIITLIFTAFAGRHGTQLKLTGMTVETRVVQCVAGQPCPAFQLVVNTVIQPQGASPHSLSAIDCAALTRDARAALAPELRAACT